VFFIVGALILWIADVDEGRRIAREAQARARPVEEVAPEHA
jgi:hypothetical protein